MDEQEIRTWAYDQARMKAQYNAPVTNAEIESDALRIACFVQTGSFDEAPKAESDAPKTW